MPDDKEIQIKFDPGSPIGCGLAVLVFIFAIVSLNMEFFTDMTNWSLKDTPEMKYKDTTTFWFMQYANIPSLVIVIFGTITALVISLPLDRISNVPKILSNVWKTENWSYLGIIDQICDYAAKARKHGTFSLDKEVQTLPEGYMKDWLDLMITERDPKKLKVYMFTEMANMANRHKNGADFFKKGRLAAIGMANKLKNGEVIGLTNDQILREGILVPFFGKKAPTPHAAAIMSLKWDVPIFMVRLERIDMFNFKMTIEDEIKIKTNKKFDDKVYKLTEVISQRIEQWIIERPEQWLWAHRRWGK